MNITIYYSADNIWIIGRRQQKKGTEVAGYDFVINIEKSRYVREKSKIPIRVTWEAGIEEYSGLLDVAIAGGYVAKPSNGFYCHVDMETGELIGKKLREKDTLEAGFWTPVFENTNFKEFVKAQYQIAQTPMIEDFNLDITQEGEK